MIDSPVKFELFVLLAVLASPGRPLHAEEAQEKGTDAPEAEARTPQESDRSQLAGLNAEVSRARKAELALREQILRLPPEAPVSDVTRLRVEAEKEKLKRRIAEEKLRSLEEATLTPAGVAEPMLATWGDRRPTASWPSGFLLVVLTILVIGSVLLRDVLRDVCKGLLVLLERPYQVHDVVKLGEVAGVVEGVLPRVTVLRDRSGAVHYIPHGQVAAVTNLSRAWSRASLDVQVAYEEDVDRVMTILREAADEVRRDPSLSGAVRDDPELIAVDSFEDSGALLRVSVKTQPLREREVEEALRERIGRRLEGTGLAAGARDAHGGRDREDTDLGSA